MATANDFIQNESIAHAIWVSRYSTGVAKRIVNLLNQSDAELVARLLVAMDGLDAKSFTVERLESLLGSVREVNIQAIDSIQASLSSEMLAFAQHEAGYQLSLFTTAIPEQVIKQVSLQSISAQQAYSAAMSQPFQGRLLKGWMKNLEADRMARISNVVRQGFLLGDTTEQIARKVRGHANKGYQDSALQLSRSNAISITKTALGHMGSVSRDHFANANSDIVKGKRWISTLDNRTTPECRIRDQLIYTMDNKPIGHKIPYLQGPGKLHFCCRSTEVLVLKSAKELGLDIRDISNSSRASMDGQIPSEINYSDWLKNQKPDRQDEILGKTRASLMRDGGLSFDEFYTDKGEYLSLEQLKRIDSEAFRRTRL